MYYYITLYGVIIYVPCKYRNCNILLNSAYLTQSIGSVAVCLMFFRLLRDPRAGYQQSLNVLRHAKNVKPNLVTKSSIMLGVGETDEEILQTMKGTYSFVYYLLSNSLNYCIQDCP